MNKILLTSYCFKAMQKAGMNMIYYKEIEQAELIKKPNYIENKVKFNEFIRGFNK